MVTEGNIHKSQVNEKLVAGEVQYFICYALYLAVFFHSVTYFFEDQKALMLRRFLWNSQKRGHNSYPAIYSKLEFRVHLHTVQHMTPSEFELPVLGTQKKPNLEI